MFKHASTAAIASLALAACGDDERLTAQQFSAEATPQIERVSAGFGAVFASIGKADEADPVPAAALEALREVAATEEEAAGAIDALAPPEAAEAPVDRFVEAAREQADQLRALAAGSASVKEVADAVEDPAVADALAALAEDGLADVKPPAQH